MSELHAPFDARPPMPTLADDGTNPPGDQLSTDFGVAWVVHDVVSRGDSTEMWAWCKIAPDGEPGYQEIIAMKHDGVTRVPFPPGGVLGKVIVKLWC